MKFVDTFLGPVFALKTWKYVIVVLLTQSYAIAKKNVLNVKKNSLSLFWVQKNIRRKTKCEIDYFFPYSRVKTMLY